MKAFVDPMKASKFPDARERKRNVIIGLIIITLLIIFIILWSFSFLEGAAVHASDQVPAIARSFSQYFSPKVLRYVDAYMAERSYSPLDYWKIWTYGFHRTYKDAEGKKQKIILNWDGFFYFDRSEPLKIVDWTQIK